MDAALYVDDATLAPWRPLPAPRVAFADGGVVPTVHAWADAEAAADVAVRVDRATGETVVSPFCPIGDGPIRMPPAARGRSYGYEVQYRINGVCWLTSPWSAPESVVVA